MPQDAPESVARKPDSGFRNAAVLEYGESRQVESELRRSFMGISFSGASLFPKE